MKGRVLVVDDHTDSADALADVLRAAQYDAVPVSSGRAALDALRGGAFDAVVTDLRMDGMDGIGLLREVGKVDPELPVLLVTAFASIDRAVEATRAGAFCFLTKPIRPAEIEAQVRNAVALRKATRSPEPGPRELMLGRSAGLLRALAEADRAACSAATVLVTGETGTGKELLAKRIHERSPRARGRLVTVNAGAIPENLIEGELFGHARGAFTGAVADRPGLFEEAHQGTLFLDEVGELSAAAQTRLLRVLQEGIVRRLGENRDRSVDVRVIAATHRDLQAQESFRKDLYFRLHVLPIALPPLRERGDDVLLLFGRALAEACARAGRTVPSLASDVIELLLRYRWPGNVRELFNVAERLAVLGPGTHVNEMDLPGEIRAQRAPDGVPGIPEADFDLTAYLESVEETVLRRALQRHDGVKAKAAASLGLERNAFRYKLKKYGIEE